LIRRFVRLLLFLFILAIGLLVYTFIPWNLTVDPAAGSGIGRNRRPLADLPDDVSLAIVRAGKMPARQLFSYRGGSLTGPYENGMIAVLVRHGEDLIALDTGFGSKVDEHWKTIPALMRSLSSFEKERPLKEQLAATEISPDSLKRIFITHSHWDHISGLEDFPSVETWMPEDELAFIKSGAYPGLADQIIDRLHVRTFSFKDAPYENFPSSYDLYSDGSVVFVPIPGHTPGSTGMFVNFKSGKRFLFIGDLTWAREGIDLPAERPWLARKLVDMDEARVREMIQKVHALKAADASLVVVPAHDRRVHEELPSFPQFVN